MTTDKNPYGELSDVDNVGSTSLLHKSKSLPGKDSGLVLFAILSIGGLAIWNLVRMFSLTPEVNGFYGTGPMPHRILGPFVAMWTLVTSVWFVITIFLWSDRRWTQAAIAAVASGVCIVVLLINGFLWWQCFASI